MTTVLLTGFEPFAGAASNSSWDAPERVAINVESDDAGYSSRGWPARGC
jgi:pyrrolidone-carboxylate peptidase